MSSALLDSDTAGLTVDKLKDLCRANKLTLGGNKDELIERIKKHVAAGNKLKPAAAGYTPAEFKQDADETWQMRTLKALAANLGLPARKLSLFAASWQRAPFHCTLALPHARAACVAYGTVPAYSFPA